MKYTRPINIFETPLRFALTSVRRSVIKMPITTNAGKVGIQRELPCTAGGSVGPTSRENTMELLQTPRNRPSTSNSSIALGH